MALVSRRITVLGQYIDVAFERYESHDTMTLVQFPCS